MGFDFDFGKNLTFFNLEFDAELKINFKPGYKY